MPTSTVPATLRLADWLEDTERRCPVTDNIKAASTVEVVIASA